MGLYVPLVCISALKRYVKDTPERRKTWWYRIFSVVCNIAPFVGIIITGHIAYRWHHYDWYRVETIKNGVPHWKTYWHS